MSVPSKEIIGVDAVESTATARVFVVVYGKYVAVDLIGVSVSTTTSKLLLSAW